MGSMNNPAKVFKQMCADYLREKIADESDRYTEACAELDAHGDILGKTLYGAGLELFKARHEFKLELLKGIE